MSKVRVLALRLRPINSDKLWREARGAWANLLDISDVDGDGMRIGFDFDGTPPPAIAVQMLLTAHDPTPIAPPSDKSTVIAFMNAPSGTATPVQRDDTMKAVINYLRRRGDDA